MVTHRRPEETGPAVRELIEVARAAGARLVFDPREAEKHGLQPAEGVEFAEDTPRDVDLCFALGGDGTILRGLRQYAGTGVPVFGVNFGEVGFLATVEREEARSAFERALAGEFDVLALPGIAARVERRRLDRDQRRLGRAPAWPARRDPRLLGGLRTRSAACAATGWWWPPRPGRPATTSPTAGR